MRFLRALVLLLLLLASRAEASEALASPIAASRSIEAAIQKCIRTSIPKNPMGNQLITAGISACYQHVQSLWQGHAERAKAEIAQRFGTGCAAFVEEFETKVANYSSELKAAPSLAQMPLN